jgi:hypothetical protein
MNWAALLNSPQQTTAGTALASSTTLTDISPVPQLSLPANYAGNGTAFLLRATGVFSTTGTPTLRLGFYYGAVAGVSLADTGTVTTASGVTNVQWVLEAVVTVRSNGATGTAWTQGTCAFGTSATAMSLLPLPGAAPTAVTVDTTAAKQVTVGAQWGTSSASNTVTCHSFQVVSLGY